MSAAESGEEFYNFGPSEFFAHEDVADEVLWPLVDYYYRGDWRSKSYITDELVVPMRLEDDVETRAMLMAGCAERLSENGPFVEHSVTLSVEEETPDALRDFMLEKAKESAVEQWGYADLDIEDEEDEDEAENSSHMEHESEYETEVDMMRQPNKWPSGDPDDFLVGSGKIYSFQSSGGFHSSAYRYVRGQYGGLNYPPTGEEATPENDMRLFMPDLEIIENGCYIFNAPAAIMEALAHIKDRPISIH